MATRPVDAELEAAWKKPGQALKGLAPLARALGPELARWPGELLQRAVPADVATPCERLLAPGS